MEWQCPWYYQGHRRGQLCVLQPKTAQFWLLDYRIFAPDTDGKTKIDHVLDMLASVKNRGIAYGYVLMDSWYAVTTS